MLWIVACQAPLSREYSRQQYWSGLPCPPPGDASDPGIQPTSLMSPALANEFFFFTNNVTWEASLINTPTSKQDTRAATSIIADCL